MEVQRRKRKKRRRLRIIAKNKRARRKVER